MGSNIVLVGFMGVGKGSVARNLAKECGLFAIDTDDLIESLEKRKIKKIFKKGGELYFRALEQRVANWLCENVNNTIVSTGGGFYKVSNLKEIGKIIYLKAGFDWIVNRLESHPKAKQKFKKRPLFREKWRAKELYDQREEAYERVADIVIVTENKTSQEVALELKGILAL